jgi:hypothetical protein
MKKALATCGEGTIETTGVFHDLRELQVPEARLTMFKAVQGLNAEEGTEVEVLRMRQCARCAVLFTEFVGPGGRTLLHMHLPPEGLMI